MLKQRIVFGSLMSAAVLAVFVVDCWFDPYYPIFAVVAALVAAATSRELAGLLAAFPFPVRPWFCIAGGLLIPMSVFLAPIAPAEFLPFLGGPNPNLRPPAATFVGLCMAAFLIEALGYRQAGKALPAIAAHATVFFYVGLLGSFVILLRWFDFGHSRATGAYLLASFVFTAKFADIGAFFVGRRFGAAKLAPQLSPNKTIEGSAGGVAASILFALLANAVGRWTGAIPEIPWYAALLFGLVISASAQVGDLMESLIKRDCQQKDASHSIPGFGGVLDVVDSVFFAAPVAYALFSVWNTLSAAAAAAAEVQ
jgi:phosphatidate cytidylyltransferase